MFGTLINLLTKRPDLIVDHLFAYSALARSEIEITRRHLVRRALAGLIAAFSGLAFVVLAGVAAMLATSGQPYTPWVLWAIPGTLLVVTLIALLVALSKDKSPLRGSLSQQLQRDVQAFRGALKP
jgi:hypothetical protein